MPLKRAFRKIPKPDLQQYFASPFNDDGDRVQKAIDQGMIAINSLKPAKDNGTAYLGKQSALTLDLAAAKGCTLPHEGSTLATVIEDIVHSFEGLPNWGHPLNLSNVCPQENLAAIVAALVTQVFSPNALEGEYAWNTAKAEVESASMLANLAGWNSQKAGGLYTYGGSGCWLYHLKYALAKVVPHSREKGIRTDAKIICSDQAHYAMLNSTDWAGLGTDNIIKIETVAGSNEMDSEHLEEVLRDCVAKNIPVASVVCTMATTDANAFDPVKRVRRLLTKYPNGKGYGKALLYCDAVIGWSWLTFKQYDFESNPLAFSEPTLFAIKKNYNAVKDILYADAFGVDFHKCFCPLNSSLFVYKNAHEFERLLRRTEAAYLQKRSPYNPHDYTLEVSRSASGSMAGWATLKSLGAEGFQRILGTVLENKMYLLKQLQRCTDIVCVNEEDTGWATLLRIYGKDVVAAQQYGQELNDPKHRGTLVRNNKMLGAIGELLWKWFREGKQLNGKPTAYLSITTGFRPALYNAGCQDKKAVIYALKVYPVSVFVTKESIDHAIACISAARDAVAAGFT